MLFATRMSRRAKIYEGKAKILFEGSQPGTIIQHFKDDATAFNRQKQGVIEGKGVLNNYISEFIMRRLEEISIPTHFISRINMREQLVRQVEIIPLEVVVRNVAAGSLAKRLGIKEGEPLSRPLVEFYYKKDELGDPLVTEEHILAFNWASNYEITTMINVTLRINDFLSGLFAGIGLKLIDFKVEYGRLYDEEHDEPQILLADEISPDNCRLRDIKTGEPFDKDRFRKDLGNIKEAYQEVARRLGVLPGDGTVSFGEESV
jgi:phosphoribosylaminoimidazole-succinocarboxamide synthase